MKDTLILEHKIFISAKRAVQISGYTSDYIGQLCRAGKLECKMVGKSWFLTEESLLKYRLSTKQESVVEDKSSTSQTPSSTTVNSDSVILDRMNFISAKRAAEISGYTADYVGQLCRLGKLESRRVGKAWFVSEKSLLNHCVAIAQEAAAEEAKKSVATTPAPVAVPVAVPVVSPITSPIVRVKIAEPTPTVVYPKKVTFENVQVKSNVLSISYFSKLSLLAVLSILVAFIAIQYLSSSKSFTILPSSIYSSPANVIDNADITREEDKSPPKTIGLSVVPSSGSVSQDEVLKEKIRESFSDEVLVKPDKSGTAGVITPVFKKAKGNDFVYVMVPVKN